MVPSKELREILLDGPVNIKIDALHLESEVVLEFSIATSLLRFCAN